MFKFNVAGQHLTVVEKPLAVSDTIKYLSAEFTFSDDWQGLDKWAHFKRGSTTYDINLVNDAIPASAGLNLASGSYKVYLHGSAYTGETTVQRITTSAVIITVQQADVLNGQPLPTVPPSATEQILAKVSNASNKADAAALSASSAQASATSAQTSATAAATSASQAAASASGKYTKPSGGIPKTDLSDGVQTSLGKADSALQEHQSLEAYRTASDQDEIDNGLAEDINELVDTKYEKPSDGIPSTDMTEAVQTSLGKADTALQEHQSLSAYRTSAEQDVIDSEKVSDIKINGTSIVDDNGVGIIPKGSANGLGVLGVWSGGGTDVAADGTIKLQRATDENIINRDNYYRPIVSKNLDYAVKRSLTDGIAPDWSEAEQKACRKRIGEDKYELIEEVTLTEAVRSLNRTTETDGTAYNFKKVFVALNWKNETGTASQFRTVLKYRRGDFNITTDGMNSLSIENNKTGYNEWIVDCADGIDSVYISYATYSASNWGNRVKWCKNNVYMADSNINYLEVLGYPSSTTIPAGTTIKIYAIRA